MNYTIEKNVPLAKYAKNRRESWNYPLGRMEKGDSFIVEEDYTKKNTNLISARVRTLKEEYSLGKRKFSISKDPVGSTKIRIWRVN